MLGFFLWLVFSIDVFPYWSEWYAIDQAVFVFSCCIGTAVWVATLIFAVQDRAACQVRAPRAAQHAAGPGGGGLHGAWPCTAPAAWRPRSCVHPRACIRRTEVACRLPLLPAGRRQRGRAQCMRSRARQHGRRHRHHRVLHQGRQRDGVIP